MKFRIVHTDEGFLLQREWFIFWTCACFEDSADRRNRKIMGSWKCYFETAEQAEKWAHNMYPVYKKFRYVYKVFEINE